MGKIRWNDPRNEEGWNNAKRALKEDRGKSVVFGTMKMPRGLKVGDPLSRVKSLFPNGPVSFSGGPDGHRSYTFIVTEPEVRSFVVICVGEEIAFAAERAVPRSVTDQVPLEPYAWSEVPAELARMERDDEANSRPRPARKQG
jgi:hypothetical protein